MIDHAVLLAPLGLAASTRCKMALLGTDDTTVALRQSHETRVAVPLVETLVGFAIAMDAVDYAVELQLQLPAQILVEGNFLLAQYQGV